MISSNRIARVASLVSALASKRVGKSLQTIIASAATLFFFAALLIGPLAAPVAAQDQPPQAQPAPDQVPKPVEDTFAVATQDALTKAIAARERQAWTAFKKNDAAAFAALTTEDYRSVLGNGALHFYRPTAQEMAAINVTQYIISQFHAAPIGNDGALVTFIGQFSFQNGSAYGKFAFGEVWVKQGDEWKCQYSQATFTL